MKNILIVCTGNTCRSPMAEGVLNKLIKDNKLEDISVLSMGISAFDGEGATFNAVEALKEIGVDISKHQSKRVMLSDIYDADVIYVMTKEHKEILINACKDCESKIKVIEVKDPFGQDLEIYRQARDTFTDYFKEEFNVDGK
ncbi:MAG: low molecular weight protein arginine phosphatase [Oscillospiraceae bacterium]